MKRAKRAQRLAATLLCAAMMANTIPTAAFAEDAEQPVGESAQLDMETADSVPPETGDASSLEPIAEEPQQTPMDTDVEAIATEAELTTASEQQIPVTNDIPAEQKLLTNEEPADTADAMADSMEEQLREETAAVPVEAGDKVSVLVGALEDTYTHSYNNDAGKNFGTTKEMRIRNTNKYYACVYEKFDLSEIISTDSGLISSIYHQMTLSSKSADAGTVIDCGYLADNDWSANEITYSNFTKNHARPESISQISLESGIQQGALIETDISGILAIKQNWTSPLVSLELSKPYIGTENVSIFSKDNGSNAPALKVVYEAAYTADNTKLDAVLGQETRFTLPLQDSEQNAVLLESVYLPEGASLNTDTGEVVWTPEASGKDAIVLRVKRGNDILGYYLRLTDVSAPEQATKAVEFKVEADTYTHSYGNDSNKALGGRDSLRMRNNNKYYAHVYERFDLSQLIDVEGALLHDIAYRMTISGAVDAATTVDVAWLDNNEWEEGAVTYNSFTAAGQSSHELTRMVIPAGSAANTDMTTDLTGILTMDGWSWDKLTLDMTNEYGGSENVFTYSKENAKGGSSLTATYNTTYTADNTALTRNYHDSVTFSVPVQDIGGKAVVLKAIKLPEGADFDADTGGFSWTADTIGKNPVVISVSSGKELLGYYVRLINVAETRPQFRAEMKGETLGDSPVAVRTDSELSITVKAAAPGGDLLPVRLTAPAELPAGAVYNSDTGIFTWTPTDEQEGSYTFIWSAENGGTTADYSLTVTAVNKYTETDALYAEADTYVNSNSGSTTKNYGADTVLTLRGGYKWAYLRFPLHELKNANGFITDISLQLTTTDAPTNENGEPAAVTTTPILLTTDSWNEGTLVNKVVATGSNAVTYANMPSYYNESTYLNCLRFSRADESLRSSVTEAVLSEYWEDGKISFCLRNIDSKNNTTFYSRENGDESITPALVITKDCGYAVPETQTVRQGQTMTVALPQQKLDGTPALLTMDSMPANAVYKDGVLSWTPDGSQQGNYTVAYHATYQNAAGKTIYGFFSFTVTVSIDTNLWGIGGTDDVVYANEGETIALTPYSEPIYVQAAAEALQKAYARVTLAPNATAADLQQAINNVSEAGGGVVSFEQGTYVLNDTIELKSDVTLQGAGTGATVLQKSETLTIPDGQGLLYTKGGVQDAILRDLTIDVNAANAPEDNSNYGLLIIDSSGQKNYRVLLESIEVINAGMGLHAKGTYDLIVRNSTLHDNGWGKAGYYHNIYIRRVYRALVENCTLYNAAGGNGMNITDCEDIKVVNCDAHDNYWRGYKAANTQRVAFYGCKAVNNRTQDGFTMAVENGGVSDFVIENCLARGNGRNGIYLNYGTNGYVLNCTGENNSEGFYSDNRGSNVTIDETVSAEWTAENLPAGAVLYTANGEMTWATTFADAGMYRSTLSADLQGSVLGQKTARKDVVIIIQNMTDPVFEAVNEQKASINQPFALTLTAKDPENTALTLAAYNMPYGMKAVQGENNTLVLTWTPQSYQIGSWTITAEASSADGSRKSQTQFIIRVSEAAAADYDRAAAEQLLQNIEIGYKNGQYSHYAVSLLRDVLANPDASDAEINIAVQKMQALVNTDATGDVDGDGMRTIGDLQLIAENYHKEDSRYDTDGNGVVELEDMVFAARNVQDAAAGLRRVALEADGASYIDRTTSGKAYHVQETLQTKDAAFVTFDLNEAAVPGEIVEAVLELHTVSEGQSGTVNISVMNQDTGVCNWDGTYSALYAAGSTSLTGAELQGDVLSVNITAAVQDERAKDGRITLKLQSTDALTFFSDNSSVRQMAPRLSIRVKASESGCAAIDAINADLNALALDGYSSVTDNLPLVSEGANGTQFTWKSLDTDYLADDGTVCRPAYETEDVPVELVVTAKNNGIETVRRYTMLIARATDPVPTQTRATLETVVLDSEVTDLVNTYWNDGSFTYVTYPTQILGNDKWKTVTEMTGNAIQAAVDEVNAAGGGVVELVSGVYTVDKAIQMRSNVTLVGQGRLNTVLKQAEVWNDSANAMLLKFDKPNGNTWLTDIVVKDLSLCGIKTSDVDVSGIFGNADDIHHNRIMLQNVSIKHFAGIGFEVKRADNIIMDHSTFIDNGSSNSLYHNVYFLYNKNILQSDLEMSRPTTGKSCKYTSTTNVIAQHIVMRDGKSNAVQADNTGAEHILFHDYTIDNYEGYGLWFPCEDYMDKFTYKEDPIFAPQYVILNRVSITNTKTGGIWRIVKNSHILNSYFNNRRDNLQLLKCDVDIQNTVFEGPDNGPTYYSSKDELPDPIL